MRSCWVFFLFWFLWVLWSILWGRILSEEEKSVRDQRIAVDCIHVVIVPCCFWERRKKERKTGRRQQDRKRNREIQRIWKAIWWVEEWWRSIIEEEVEFGGLQGCKQMWDDGPLCPPPMALKLLQPAGGCFLAKSLLLFFWGYLCFCSSTSNFIQVFWAFFFWFTHCTHLSWCDLTSHFGSISSHVSHSRHFRACWWRTSWELALKSCWNIFLSNVLLNLWVCDPHWKVLARLVARRRGLCYRSQNGILVQLHNRVMEDLPWFLDSGETEIVFWLRESHLNSLNPHILCCGIFCLSFWRFDRRLLCSGSLLQGWMMCVDDGDRRKHWRRSCGMFIWWASLRSFHVVQNWYPGIIDHCKSINTLQACKEDLELSNEISSWKDQETTVECLLLMYVGSPPFLQNWDLEVLWTDKCQQSWSWKS